MTPSTEQSAVLSLVETTDKNIVISAKAGSGKTTTLRMIVGVVPEYNHIACVAFNRVIRDELERKLPNHVDVMTCHGLGMKYIRGTRPNVRINNSKAREALQMIYPTWLEYQGVEYAEAKTDIDAILKMVDLCRLNLSRDMQDIADRYGIDYFPGIEAKVRDVINAMTRATAEIDYVEMVYLPAVDKSMQGLKYDLILVDECQDISAAQRALIVKSLAPGGRLISVGDPYQAIYGFAGADSESFQRLTEIPNTVVMPLNNCYRCGTEIVRFAQRIVPEIMPHPGNDPGQVNEKAKMEEISAGDMVLCRLTAPLVRLAYKLIGQGKPAFIRGREIGQSVIAFVKKSRAQTMDQMDRFMMAERVKLIQKLARQNPALTLDEVKALPAMIIFDERREIIGIISDNLIGQSGPICNLIVAQLERMFSDIDPGTQICLSTIHKAKGLECDRVFILDRHNMPSKWAKKDWELIQEKNLEYVAYTRAIKYLGFISDWTSDNQGAEDI